MKMKMNRRAVLVSALLVASGVNAKANPKDIHGMVSNREIAVQRDKLAKNTQDNGFGPQSPRDIDSKTGNNHRNFSTAPASSKMNLCNIHFHKNAEHKGGEFTQYVGNGDGHGYQSGFLYSGHLSTRELNPVTDKICPSKHGALGSGDTIEVHYVYSTAKVNPGPTLGSCLNDAINNPQLRVETQIYVLVNNSKAQNFGQLTQYGFNNGYQQALNIPENTGIPVEYSGSTTGPDYNEKGSPFQVTWRVRPQVTKVDIQTLGKWCEGNIFNEDHAHGVRNLVVNPDLLSIIN